MPNSPASVDALQAVHNALKHIPDAKQIEREDGVVIELYDPLGYPYGLVLTFPKGNVPASIGTPTFTVASDDETAFAYLIDDDDPDAIDCLAADLKNLAGYEVSAGAPIPGPGWALAEGATWKRYSVAEMRTAFSGVIPASRISDAEIWGQMTPEIADLPIVVSIARKRDALEWKTNKPQAFSAMFEQMFSRHLPGEKDGNSIVTGSLGQTSKRRTKNNVLANYLLGIDVDSGASLEETFAKVRKMGLTAIFYTTHSMGSTRIDIAYDKYHRWCDKNDIDPEPTIETIRRYLAEETAYISNVRDTVEFVEKKHDDGMKLILQCRPLDKFRILFPLQTPYVYAEQSGMHKDVISAWEGKVLGMGRALGIEIDKVARDPSRLFYLPRHGKNATNYRIMLICGKLLRYEDVKTARVRDRVSDDPFDQAAHGMDATGRERIEVNGLDLGQWARERGHAFDIAALFRDHCPDRIRHEQSPDKISVECPHDEEHSNPGDPEDMGTFVCSGGMEAEQFQFHCSHAGCYGRDRLKHLQKAVGDGWFTTADLLDKAYVNDPEFDNGTVEDEATRHEPEKCIGLRGTGFTFNAEKDPDWIRVAGKNGDSVCQPFVIDQHFEDASGERVTYVVGFLDKGRKKSCTINRGDLWERPATVKGQLGGVGFRLAGNGDLAIELLRKVAPALNGRWVSQRGWHGDAYLTIGGQTIKPKGSTTPTLRLFETTREDFEPGGTLDGWKHAVEPIWTDNAEGREHLAVGIMMGVAGPIFGRCHPSGFRMLSLHGPSSRGKSLACKLLSSVSGPATAAGCYINLRATANGIEAVLPDLSGHTCALDEGQHIEADDANELVFMMESGAGKVAATQNRSARKVRQFGGLAMMANEKPWAQKLKDAHVDVSPGFDARVLDINIASVKDYPKGEASPLTTQLHGIKDHYGHVLPLVVGYLLDKDQKRILRQIERLTTALVGKDALGLEARAMETMAWVWLGGIVGKKLGIIPANFSVGRVIRWARDNRVADASRPVNERVLSTLLTSISRGRKVDLYRWETFEPDANLPGLVTDDVERVYKPWAGIFYVARTGEELIVNADSLRKMAGSICSETEVAQYLRDAGYLRMEGKNLFHKDLPMRNGKAERVKNYRIKSSFYLSDGPDEPESSVDGSQ